MFFITIAVDNVGRDPEPRRLADDVVKPAIKAGFWFQSGCLYRALPCLGSVVLQHPDDDGRWNDTTVSRREFNAEDCK